MIIDIWAGMSHMFIDIWISESSTNTSEGVTPASSPAPAPMWCYKLRFIPN